MNRPAHELPLLASTKIASPCNANWEDMAGDDKMRFCSQCKHHVHNLSAMTRDEAEEWIQSTSGSQERQCIRLFRRSDGTVLTADCPVGIRRWRLALLRSVAAACSFLFSGVAIAASGTALGKWAQSQQQAEVDMGILALGEMCLPAPTNPTPNTITPNDPPTFEE